MSFAKRGLPTGLAVLFGLLTLLGLVALPSLANLLLSWTTFLAAFALILGVVNLLIVHGRRSAQGNANSLVLMLGIAAMFTLYLTDRLALTDGSLRAAFRFVQAPLEAAVSSLVAFFLLFAGVRLMRRRRSIWSVLFLLTAVLFLLAQGPLPAPVASAIYSARDAVQKVVVTAGMRGLLLGIALGIITLSLRLLAGVERPYNP
jgi:hypothetical protein